MNHNETAFRQAYKGSKKLPEIGERIGFTKWTQSHWNDYDGEEMSGVVVEHGWVLFSRRFKYCFVRTDDGKLHRLGPYEVDGR